MEMDELFESILIVGIVYKYILLVFIFLKRMNGIFLIFILNIVVYFW